MYILATHSSAFIEIMNPLSSLEVSIFQIQCTYVEVRIIKQLLNQRTGILRLTLHWCAPIDHKCLKRKPVPVFGDGGPDMLTQY